MALNPFQQLDVIRGASFHGRQITDCYRLMYKKSLWIHVYHKLYSHNKRTNMKTFDEVHINGIIKQLRMGTFRFTTTVNHPKQKSKCNNDSMIWQGIENNLVVEVIYIILNNIYDPVLHELKKHSNRQATLRHVKKDWEEITWCIRREFVGPFNQRNQQILLRILAERIKDRRFLSLLHHTMKSGILANWQFSKMGGHFRTESNLPFLLVDVYLHDLDLFIERQRCIHLGDKQSTEFKYVRYGNEFIIGISGNKKIPLKINEMIENYVANELALNLKRESPSVVHLKRSVLFLDYQFKVCPNSRAMQIECQHNRYSPREINTSNSVKLEIPKNKMSAYAIKNRYGNLACFKATYRPELLNLKELDILNVYNRELRQFANYYQLASNFHHLSKLFYLAKGSFIRTLAYKRRKTPKEVASSLAKHQQGYICLEDPSKTIEGKYQHFIRLKDLLTTNEKKHPDYSTGEPYTLKSVRTVRGEKQ